MGLIRSSSADVPQHSTGGRISNEIIGVDTLVETGGTPNVVPLVSDESDEYVLVSDVEDEDDAVSITSSESDSESDDEDESDDEYDEEDEVEDDIEEKMIIMADAFNLKLLARNYLCPDDKIVTNGIMGRCFFNRASAPDVMSKEEADEYAMILADAKALKTDAEGYHNPELVICETDPTVFGRNYYAPDDEAEERAKILKEATMLKQSAAKYQYPEDKVETSNATLFGRNYFNRFDSSNVVSKEDAEERAQILADAAALKKEAVYYNYPEAPVHVDPTAFGRNFFMADSDSEVDEEREQILGEATMLKELATNYQHPEFKVDSSDATLFGRNYFNRFDGSEVVEEEDAEERAQILADAAALKKEAVYYNCPEAPVHVDPTAFGRNFFMADSESEVDEEEREQILGEATMLKELATNFQHPEVKVDSSDATLFGRNYFNRFDGYEVVKEEDAEERAQILANAAALKKEAVYYNCPEAPVHVDPTAFGRNFFVADSDSEVDEEECEQILGEASNLKELAANYHHPEVKVNSSDATLFGRNYFNRFDGSEVVEEEDAEERAQILADAAALRKEAAYYNCPEASVDVDPTAFGKNFFIADSECEVDEEERTRILSEATMLKELAANYQHPAVKVKTSDTTLFGRNYFNRSVATELNEEIEERVQILSEGNELKKTAVDYCHPERAIPFTDPSWFARNFFHTPKLSSYDAQMVDVEGTEDDRHEMFEFDDGYDQFTDLRKQLNFISQPQKPINRSASFANFAHKTIEVEEEEGHLSRSPSCVAFF